MVDFIVWDGFLPLFNILKNSIDFKFNHLSYFEGDMDIKSIGSEAHWGAHFILFVFKYLETSPISSIAIGNHHLMSGFPYSEFITKF